MSKFDRRLAGHRFSAVFYVVIALLSGATVWSNLITPAQAVTDAEPVLRVSAAYYRILPPGQRVTAAYMHIENTSESVVELQYVESPLLDRIEIHEHQHENGMMRMRKVSVLAIDPGQQLTFSAGGYHLMLFGEFAGQSEGAELPVTLVTKDGQRIDVRFRGKSIVGKRRQ